MATGAGGGGGGGGVAATAPPAVRFTCTGLPWTLGGAVGGFVVGAPLTVKVTLPEHPAIDWISTK